MEKELEAEASTKAEKRGKGDSGSPIPQDTARINRRQAGDEQQVGSRREAVRL